MEGLECRSQLPHHRVGWVKDTAKHPGRCSVVQERLEEQVVSWDTFRHLASAERKSCTLSLCCCGL